MEKTWKCECGHINPTFLSDGEEVTECEECGCPKDECRCGHEVNSTEA